MKLKTDQIIKLFQFQIENPLVATEETLEDLQTMIKYAKSHIEIVEGSKIFKYFVEKDGKYTLYYVSGFDNLTERIESVMRKAFKVNSNGGVPIFVEG